MKKSLRFKNFKEFCSNNESVENMSQIIAEKYLKINQNIEALHLFN
jgi:hypothetical protein